MSTVVHHWFANALIAYRRHQATETLSKLTDHQLQDIGLERFAIDAHVSASLPWQTLEREPKTMLQTSIQGCG